MPHHVSGINFLVLSVNLIPVLLSLFMLLSHLLTLSTIPLSPFITPSLFHSRLKTYPFGRPFVKRFALCYRSVVLSVCTSVCDVGVLWPNGWTDQDETWHAGRPRALVHKSFPPYRLPSRLRTHSTALWLVRFFWTSRLLFLVLLH